MRSADPPAALEFAHEAGPARSGAATRFLELVVWRADRLAQAITDGGIDDGLVGEISRAVQTIHPQMAWELAPGKTAQHAFCISPEGRADLRQIALRWFETAPPAGTTWEYHASKQAPRIIPMSSAVAPARPGFLTAWRNRGPR